MSGGGAPPLHLAEHDRRALGRQRRLGQICFPLVALVALCWLRGVKRLRVEDAPAVRARFRALLAEARGPVLICSNHLTLVDSLILAWALAPARDYVRDYARLPWNVPEKANFSRTPFWRLASFLGKCVFVTRGGPREEVRRTHHPDRDASGQPHTRRWAFRAPVSGIGGAGVRAGGWWRGGSR